MGPFILVLVIGVPLDNCWTEQIKCITSYAPTKPNVLKRKKFKITTQVAKPVIQRNLHGHFRYPITWQTIKIQPPAPHTHSVSPSLVSSGFHNQVGKRYSLFLSHFFQISKSRVSSLLLPLYEFVQISCLSFLVKFIIGSLSWLTSIFHRVFAELTMLILLYLVLDSII